MRSIAEWQKAAYELAVSKGFHDCRACRGGTIPASFEADGEPTCPACKGTGRVDPFKPTRIAARLALIHCEISEAVECVARSWTELYWLAPDGTTEPDNAAHFTPEQRASWRSWLRNENYKPEGFPIELADVFLRLCDLAESLGVDIPERGNEARVSDCETLEEIFAELTYLHSLATRLYKNPHNPLLYGMLYTQLHFLAVWTHSDLLAMAELKHEYNKTRPRMHGGKVL